MDELQKYQFLISNISDLVYICDTLGNIIYVNPIFEKLTGHRPEDFSGKPFAPLFDEENLSKAMDVYARTLQGETPEYELYFRDTGVLCEYKNFPLRDTGGEIIGVMGIARDISERKRAEEELRAERDRFQSYLNVSGVMFVVIDAGQKVTMINKKGCEILGYAEQEVIGADWFDTCMPARDREEARGVFFRLMTGEGDAVEYLETPVLTKNGEELMIAWHNWLLRDGAGRVIATLNSGEDITEKMRTKQALRQSRRHLRAIIDAEPECVKVVDSDGRILDINPAGAAMIEAENPDALRGVSIYSVVSPEHVEAMKELVKGVFRGAADSLEFEITGFKGTRKWLEAHAVPLCDDQGKVTSLLGITRDITEWKRTVEALMQEKQRLEDVTRHANCGLFLLDEEAKVSYMNTVAEEWFGPRDSIRGRPCWEIFGLKDPERECAGLRVLRTGETVRSEAFTRTVDGKPKAFFVMAAPVKDKTGHVCQVTEVVIDITERKHLEEQLLHMQKMESLGHLASGIAHDFNNVLSGIIGYADLGLMKLDAQHPLHENLTHIVELAGKGGGITRQLLAFARKQVLEPSHIDLNVVVANLLKLLGKTLGEQIEISFTPGKELDSVLADPARMEQALMNLCVNARDAMPGGGTIAICTRNVLLDEAACRQHPGMLPGRYVLLSVADTGTGMDESVRERIFEPFFTTKETGRGTGLGLSIVYGIIGQHKGFIEVESEHEKGTVFRIYLPATDRPAAAAGQQTFPSIRGGTETILVVEDEYDVRAMMRAVLKEYGYEVIAAANGEEGLRQFERNDGAISLVVSDMVMPKMSGMDLYHRIREISPSVRFLMVSGYIPDEERERLIAAEHMDFMHKPFGTAKFAGVVREILDRPAGEGIRQVRGEE